MEFNANVKTNPAGVLKGVFKCCVLPQGIHFTQGKNLDFLVPVGTPAEYRGQNKLVLSLPEYQIELQVNRWGAYTFRLTHDLMNFMRGQGGHPQEAAYKMPPYFWALALLPIGIPILTVGGALPGAVGGGLVMVNLSILQREEWPLGARIGGTLAISAVAYAVILGMLKAALGR
jgi:hypothetical protein